jgi:hypothetical protein
MLCVPVSTSMKSRRPRLGTSRMASGFRRAWWDSPRWWPRGRSWYPDTTPTSLARLKVPSCGRCNDEWEKVERRLGQELVMAVTPGTVEVAGVVERLNRSWQPAYARKDKDRVHRTARLQSVARTMKWAPTTPGKPQVMVRTPEGLLLRASPARLIDAPLRRLMAEKLIRGLHYAETKTPLGDVTVHAKMLINEPVPDELGDVEAIPGGIPPNDSLGPGFSYKRFHAERMSLWALLIWGQVLIISFAAAPGLVPNPQPT